MNRADIPVSFPIVWARDAGGAYIRPIPIVSQIGITDGAASLPDGFVPLNMTPVEAGGVPPFGQDMNGVLQMVSAWSQWVNAGGPITFDAAFATAIGGYPEGAKLASTVLGREWISLVDGNMVDPDAGPSVQWYSPTNGGAALILASGNFTVPAGVSCLKRVTLVGGGSGAQIGADGGSGGSGGAGLLLGRPVTPGQVIVATVAAPGVSHNYPTPGTNGGDTNFLGATAQGALGANGGAGAPGFCLAADVNIWGNPGLDFQGANPGSIIYGPGGVPCMLGLGRGGDSPNGIGPTGGGILVEW